MTETPTLQQQAQEFAEDLTTTVQSVVPGCPPFTALGITENSKVSVAQGPGEGILLTVDEQPHLLLKVQFRCRFDDHLEFLAVESSKIEVFAAASRSQPLFRYEYEREATRVPAAHLQVHAHRDALTYVMTKAGNGTPRGRKRAQAEEVPTMQQLHFPLGGHRFRPCLEDVLEMLIDEFGIDSDRKTREALAQGRMKWRQTQTKSAVRDDPSSAVEVLRGLGYDVQWMGASSAPSSRMDRLRAR